MILKKRHIELFDNLMRKSAHISVMALTALVALTASPTVYAVEVLQCEAALSETNSLTEQLTLFPGTKIQLRLSPEKKPEPAYYIGQETVNGRSRFIFFTSYGMTFVHISETEIKDRNKIQFDPQSWQISPTDQKNTQTCGAHAAAACLISHSPELRAAAMQGYQSFEDQRQALISNAIASFYRNSSYKTDPTQFYERVQQFLRENGMQTKAFALNSKQTQNELLQILQAGKPAYFIYPSALKWDSSARIVIEQPDSPLNPNFPAGNSPSLITSSRDREIGFHAVLALRAFEMGGSTAVLVADSSTGRLRLFWWSDIVQASNSKAMLAIVASEEKPQTLVSFSAREFDDLKSQQRENFANWITNSPDRIQNVTDKTNWFNQNAQVGQWVVVHKKVNYVEPFASAFSIGRVNEVGIDQGGLAYVKIQPYEFGRLREDREETWKIHSTAKIDIVKPLESTVARGTTFAEVFKNGKIGDIVSLNWSKLPMDPEQHLNTVILEKSSTKMSLYDEASGNIINIGTGDLTRNFELSSPHVWADVEPKMQAAFAILAGNTFEREGYSKTSSANIAEFKNLAFTAKLVFPYNFSTDNFEIVPVNEDTEVIIALKSRFRFLKGIDKSGNLTVLKMRLVSISATEMIVSYWGVQQLIRPEHLQSAFVVQRSLLPASP